MPTERRTQLNFTKLLTSARLSLSLSLWTILLLSLSLSLCELLFFFLFPISLSLWPISYTIPCSISHWTHIILLFIFSVYPEIKLFFLFCRRPKIVIVWKITMVKMMKMKRLSYGWKGRWWCNPRTSQVLSLNVFLFPFNGLNLDSVLDGGRRRRMMTNCLVVRDVQEPWKERREREKKERKKGEKGSKGVNIKSIPKIFCQNSQLEFSSFFLLSSFSLSFLLSFLETTPFNYCFHC